MFLFYVIYVLDYNKQDNVTREDHELMIETVAD
jgi:hypothetical protein